jgi:hypothetical protein
MGELIARDNVQLRRVEQALAAASLWSAADRDRKRYLLAALETERADLLRCRRGR